MSIRSKDQKTKLAESKKQTASKPRVYLKTESTFFNSNNTSNSKLQNQKAAKAVYKMEKNLNDLKKACNIPPKPEPVSSSKQMMAVADLQNYYALINGESTDNIQKLYRFYKEHFLPNGSSSSSNQSQSCRTNKRKTMQDIRISQPASPSKNNASIKSRRGSEVSKGSKLQIKYSNQKMRMKTQFSTKNLNKPCQFDTKNSKQLSKLESRDPSKEKHSSSKKQLKSILKKPSFEGTVPASVNKGVRGSVPILFSKLYGTNKVQRSSSSKSKQKAKSPYQKQTKNQRKKISITMKTLNNDSSKNLLSQTHRQKKEVSKSKVLNKKTQNLKLNELLDEINQLSPISNESYHRSKLKNFKYQK